MSVILCPRRVLGLVEIASHSSDIASHQYRTSRSRFKKFDIFILCFPNPSMWVKIYLETGDYVITDENNTILAVNSDGVIDFDGAGPGICRVWGLSYSGSLIADTGDNAAEVALSDECFELSSNFVTIIRSEVDGGNISLENGDFSIDICVNDGNPDVLTFVNTTSSTEAYVFIVTDENDIILNVNDSGIFDFESA